MQIYQSYWVTLPAEVREKLAQEFGLHKSAGVEVVDGVVVCDGYTNEDLMAITKEMLQSYTDSTEQYFEVLWDNALLKAGYQAKEVLYEITQEEIVENNLEKEVEAGETIQIPVEEPKKKRSKRRK